MKWSFLWDGTYFRDFTVLLYFYFHSAKLSLSSKAPVCWRIKIHSQSLPEAAPSASWTRKKPGLLVPLWKCLPPPPLAHPAQSLFPSLFVVLRENLESRQGRVQRGWPLEGSSGGGARLHPEQSGPSCAPSPSAGRVFQPSQEIRYQAAVSPKAIPGRKRTGKTAVLILPPCGLGAQRVRLQTGESGGWASCWRQGTPGRPRPRSPRSWHTSDHPGKGVAATAVEAVLCVPGHTEQRP